MSKFARNAVLNADTGVITLDGAAFPWFYGDARPALVEGNDGESVPAIQLSIACTDLTVISPSKALDAAEAEATDG